MILITDIIKNGLNETITQKQFKRDAQSIASNMGYNNNKYYEDWLISVMSTTFYRLFENDKYGYSRELLTDYVPTLKDLFPYNGPAYRALTIDIPTFSRLYTVIKDNFSDEEKKLFEILFQYGRGEIKKSKRIENVFNDALKIFLESTTNFRGSDFDSWSKSMDGINYFKQNQHGNHNVIIKGNVKGLDLLSMIDFVNEYHGRNVFSDEYTDTKEVEEVVAPMPDDIEVVSSKILKRMKAEPKASPYDFV